MISGAGDSWLRRRSPLVKLLALTAGSFALMLVFEPLPALALYALALAAALALARVPVRVLAIAHGPLLLFGLSVLLVNAMSRPGAPIAEGLPVRVTVEGVSIGLALALRGLVVGVLAVAFLASTPPRELMTSLIQHARLSPRYAFAILAGHRMLDLMPERWATIRAAQAVRAPLDRRGRPRFGPGDFGRAAFALLVASIRASERTALALESRGLREGPRTIWRPAPLGTLDAVMAAVALAAFAATAAASVSMSASPPG